MENVGSKENERDVVTNLMWEVKKNEFPNLENLVPLMKGEMGREGW